VRDQVSDVEANATCTDDSDLFTDRLASHDGIDITHYHRVIDPFNAGDPRCDSGSDNDMIKALIAQVSGTNTVTKSDINI